MLNSLSLLWKSTSSDSEERKSRDTHDDEADTFSILAIDAFRDSRKPSVEELQASLAQLRPTFQSLHEPRGGHSPPLAYVRWPNYGSMEQSMGDDSPPVAANNQTRRLSTFVAAANVMCYFLGIGLLGLPWVFASNGWIAPIIVAFFGITNSSTAVILGRLACKLKFCRNYQELSDVAFGYKGRMLVAILFYFQILMDGVVYLHLFSVTMASFLPSSDWDAWSDVSLLSTVCFIVINNFIVDRYLIYVSIVGASFSCLLALLLIYELSQQMWTLTDVLDKPTDRGLDVYNTTGGMYEIPFSDAGDSTLFGVLPGAFYKGARPLARSFGVFAYCFSGHAVLPSIVHKMERPADFPNVIFVTFSLISFLYCLVGSLGYILYDPLGAYGKKYVFMLYLLDNNLVLDVCLKLCIIIVVSAKSLLALQPLVDSAVQCIRPRLVECLLASLENDLDSEEERETVRRAREREREECTGAAGGPVVDETTFLGTGLSLTQAQRVAAQTSKRRALFALRFCLRTCLPLLILAIALVRPFSDFVSLLSLCGSLCFGVSIVIPLILFLEIFKDKITWTDKVLCFFVIFSGCMMSGITIIEYSTTATPRPDFGHGGVVSSRAA